MHEKGIIHNDLHPNNFLVKDDMIYALDGAAVKRISRSRIKTIPGLKNLSVLLCQVNRISDELLFDLVDVYAKTRDLKNIREATSTLQKFMAKSHQRMTNRYLKKIYRNSTEIISKKSFSSFMLCRRSYYTPEMASFLKNPDTAFHDSGKTILKAGNSATVIRYHIDGNDLVIKRYNMKNRRHALRRAFKKTRADISWRGAHLLMQNRINSSTPIAIMEIRFGPFRNKAYFICEYVKGKNVIDYFQNSKTEDIFKMAQSIIGVFLKFKSLMISHGDMKGTNMIIREGAPVLIDFDSMARHKMKTRFLHAHEKDVNRFLKNWQTNSDILKILKEIHL